MKLILNPTKPIYWSKESNTIRWGNFPESGKKIDYTGEAFPEIIKLLKKEVEKDDLFNIINKKFKIERQEFDSVIECLLQEKLIMTSDEYNKLLSSKKYNRQNLYFYMLSDNIKSTEKYKNKNILILGLGGIGSIIAELLTRAGFENFTIVDYDVVEESNLIRQLAYTESNIGQLKINALDTHLKSINRNCKIKKINKEITKEEDIKKHIESSDFVVCTLDKPIRKIRRIINKLCVLYNKPVIFSGFAEHVGMVGPFVVPHKSACLSCIDKENKEEFLENITTAPSFGPLCSVIASIASSEIINYFINFKDKNLIGCTLMINMTDYKTKTIHWDKNKNCKECGEKK